MLTALVERNLITNIKYATKIHKFLVKQQVNLKHVVAYAEVI